MCIGGIQFLEEVRKSHKYVNIRIITPVNDEIRKISVDLKRNFGIDVKHIVDSMQSKITLVVIDKKIFFGGRITNDTKDNIYESAGLGIYSNISQQFCPILQYLKVFGRKWI